MVTGLAAPTRQRDLATVSAVRAALRLLGNLVRIGLWPLWLLVHYLRRPRTGWVEVRLAANLVEVPGRVSLWQRVGDVHGLSWPDGLAGRIGGALWFNAKGNDLSIETLEVAYERIERA
jgi:hypothetical protein